MVEQHRSGAAPDEGWPLPAGMAERAARFAAEGGSPPVPRVAATVILLRPDTSGSDGGGSGSDGYAGTAGGGSGSDRYARIAEGGGGGGSAGGASAGYEVYAIRRAVTMAFGGVYAFPGGGIDPVDADPAVRWAGHPPQWWADRLRLPVPEARAVVCAAVRELFEEAGVLLAGPGPDSVVADAGAPHWEAARRALAAREQSLTALLAETDLYLRSDLLVPWIRWITPEFEPRRYDTYFFLAVLPAGQRTRDVSGEADHTLWITASEAADRYAAGELPMLPPTAATLRDLAEYGDVPALLAAAADRDPAVAMRPRVVFGPDGTAKIIIDR